MSLTKVNYIDNSTIITAQNLNDIQDNIIQNAELIKKATPRNLLDNSDFRNPVNQRGNTVYSNGYSIDRWIAMNNRSQVTVTNNGIAFCTTSEGNAYFNQIIADSVLVDGEHYTIAACIDDNIYLQSGVVNGVDTIIEESTPKGTVSLMYSSAYQSIVARFTTDDTTESVIAWMALYEGEYTADTLPEYQPKGYAAELAECQRYYRRSFNGEVTNISYVGIPIVIAPNATSLQTIMFDTPMRMTPTVTTYGYKNKQANSISDWNADTDITNTRISYVSNRGFTVGSNTHTFTANKAYCFHYEASADL